MRIHALHSEEMAFPPEECRERRPPSLRSRRHGFGMMAGAALLLLFGILILAEANAPEPGGQTESMNATQRVAPPLPIWIDIVHPIQLFDLTAPELAKTSVLYEARRNRFGGGRQDVLTFGRLNGPAPYIRLRLYRVGAEEVPNVPLYVDLARTAAEADLSIGRSLTPAEMPTRFGAFEVIDLDLSGQNISAVPCLGFRGVALAGKFLISGFACGGKTKPISRPALACLIDRLDLAEAGDDNELAAFFAESELKRNPACMGTRLAPTSSHASWLDQDDAPPPLKRKKLL